MSELLEAAGQIIGVEPYTDLHVIESIATGTLSEVELLATRSGERFVAKRYVATDAELRFQTELTTLQTLRETGSTTPPIASLRGFDIEARVIVMEALDGRTVEDLIRGTDPGLGEPALQAYARAIGLLHRAGRTRVRAMQGARAGRGLSSSAGWPAFARNPQTAAETLALISGAPIAGVAAEITDVVARTFDDAGDDRTVIQWDSWPGNAISTGRGVILVDFENSMLASQLIDVCSWHLAFPAAPLRSPFANVIPEAVVAHMDRVYAAEARVVIRPEAFAFAVASRMLFEITTPSAPKLVQGTLDGRIRALYDIRLTRAAAILRKERVLPFLASAMASVAAKVRPASPTALDPYTGLSH